MQISKILISACFLLLIIGCSETTTSRYANYQEAADDNLFLRGWVPDVLPVNSGEIVETHNIDSNERCAEAVVPVDSLSLIESRLTSIGYSEFNSDLPKLPTFGNRSNKCSFSHDSISTNRKVLAKSNELAVLDFESGKFYYWSF